MSKILKFDRNSPGNEKQHYVGEFQPIDFIESWKLGFTEGSAIKYLCRYKRKAGREDIKKILWYLQVLEARHDAKKFVALKESGDITISEFMGSQKMDEDEKDVFLSLMAYLIAGERLKLEESIKNVEKILDRFDKEHSRSGRSKNPQKPSPKGYPLPDRFHLDDTRNSRTVKFEMYGRATEEFPKGQITTGYLTVGLYADGHPGEIFIECGKEGSITRGFTDAWAIAISMLLQYGVHPAKIYDKFQGMDFEPNGFTKSDIAPIAKSIPDFVVRYMRAKFPPTKPEITDNYSTMIDAATEK